MGIVKIPSAVGKINFKIGFFLFISLGLCVQSWQVYAQQKLIFGIQVRDRAYKTVEMIRPLLNDIQQDLSRMMNDEVVIETKVFRDSDTLSNRLSEGKIDFARINPESVISTYLKTENTSLLAIETKTTSKNNPFLVVTSTQSGLLNLSQLEGRTFAFGVENSIDGENLPRWVLFRNLILTDHLKSIVYISDDQKRLSTIASGQIDAGIISKEFFENSGEKEKLKAIFEYQGILEAWMARDNMDPKLKRALEGDLIQMRRTSALQQIGRAGFVRGELADFEEVAQAGIIEEALLSQGLGKFQLSHAEDSEKIEKSNSGVAHEK
ncbi:MAG: PhnD/SsuA/transferrin family substrate-binding protein [Deltaproteobacteria bacterium]|nr:MAG: PhnD/SsuA/transferrin family substrate-binding protein [Deltaproteobacteria bacterium]